MNAVSALYGLLWIVLVSLLQSFYRNGTVVGFCMFQSFVLSASNGEFNAFSVSIAEAHRALELLEDYHARLGGSQDRALRIAIERVIRIFKSRLFQALLGES